MFISKMAFLFGFLSLFMNNKNFFCLLIVFELFSFSFMLFLLVMKNQAFFLLLFVVVLAAIVGLVLFFYLYQPLEKGTL